MKNGSVQKQPNDMEYSVVLLEDGIEVCVVYAESEDRANTILKEWKEGTYRLLHG